MNGMSKDSDKGPVNEPVTGSLLVATPGLEDPNFRRTVILLCEHGDAGSFGLVLNRLLTVKPGDVFDALEPVPHPMAYGGPVQPDTMHFIHRLGDRVPDGVELTEELTWGGDFERLQAVIEANPGLAGRARFFLGYAGWTPGQLDAEVAEGSWIVVAARSADVFASSPEELWRRTMLRMGTPFALWANAPDDPRMN